MAKADLLKWVASHSPPLTGQCPVKANAPTGAIANDTASTTKTIHETDYNRFNAVSSAAEALAALQKRSPPLTSADITAAMVEYNK
jgi:hypothetical protein